MKNSTAAKEIKSNIIAKKKFSKKKTFVKRDVYQEVTDKIIAALEAAEGDCKKKITLLMVGLLLISAKN